MIWLLTYRELDDTLNLTVTTTNRTANTTSKRSSVKYP